MDYKEMAREIAAKVGGRKNVEDATNCMTRLRLILKDDSIPNDEEIKKISGVINVIRQGGQYQIVIGTEVPKVFEEFAKILKKNQSFEQSDLNNAENTKDEKCVKKENVISKVFGLITGCMTPILPAIMAGGMVKVFLTILVTFKFISTTGTTYQIFSIMGDAPFYFIPFVLAYTAAKKMETNIVLSMSIAGVMLHPNLISLFAKKGLSVTFLGIPVTKVTYSSSVIPILIMVFLIKYIEKFAEKISPSVIKVFFKPLLVMLISAPIALIVVGPLGGFIGNGLASAMKYLVFNVGWLATTLLCALFPLLVMTGMHYALIPIGLNVLAVLGYDLFAPIMFISNIAQGAAALAVGIKTKNKTMKQTAISSGVTAIVGGITEPALYGVNMKMKQPLISAMIGAGAAGLYAGISTIYTYTAVGSSGVFTLLSMLKANSNSMVIKGVIAMCISFIVSFVLTIILVKKDSPDMLPEK